MFNIWGHVSNTIVCHALVKAANSCYTLYPWLITMQLIFVWHDSYTIHNNNYNYNNDMFAFKIDQLKLK